MYLLDGTSPDRFFLGAPRHFYSAGGLVLRLKGMPPIWILRADKQVKIATVIPPKLPAKPVKIPRPPNAYILYRKERHNIVKKTNPGISNNEICMSFARFLVNLTNKASPNLGCRLEQGVSRKKTTIQADGG